VGKTGAAAQVVQQVTDSGWLVLPFRLDRLDPTQRPAEIGRQLLGREKSPVAVLASMAAGKPSLLVIEQLDAVSVVSGRRPETFEAVASLVREARAHPAMRLMLVCRAFDLENDQRLRELRSQQGTTAETITVDLLDPQQTRDVVSQLGLVANNLTPRQVELLRLPLHLALLASVVQGHSGLPLTFGSAKELYDAFWRRKRTDLLPLLSDQNAFETLIYKLCATISARQALSVPRGLLPPGDADLDRLVSAHVLVRQGSRVGFFHEGFFDYVFARHFCEAGSMLIDFLYSAEQDLFRRSQLRQILVYRRDDDYAAYLDDLRGALSAADVRFHMKKLIVSVVGQVIDPRPEEWEILQLRLQETTGSPADPVRNALWSSAPWFRLLHEQGVVAEWLSADRPETRTFAFNWLRHLAELEPERVADLMEGLVGQSPEKDEQLLGVITWGNAATHSGRIEDLFYRLASASGRDWVSVCQAYKDFINSHCYSHTSDTTIIHRNSTSTPTCPTPMPLLMLPATGQISSLCPTYVQRPCSRPVSGTTSL